VSFSFSRTAALLGVLVLTTAGLPAWGLSANLVDPIQQDLVSGHAQDALNRISSALAQNPQDAVALELRCRVLLQERQWQRPRKAVKLITGWAVPMVRKRNAPRA